MTLGHWRRSLRGHRACQHSQRNAKRPKSDHEFASRIPHGNSRGRAIPIYARENSLPNHFQCYTPSLVKIMSSLFTHWSEFAPRIALHLFGIFVIGLVGNRLLRAVTNLLIKHAATPARAAQIREEQTRTIAGILYGLASKVIWGSFF